MAQSMTSQPSLPLEEEATTPLEQALQAGDYATAQGKYDRYSAWREEGRIMASSGGMVWDIYRTPGLPYLPWRSRRHKKGQANEPPVG
jgi:hypothetical protein